MGRPPRRRDYPDIQARLDRLQWAIASALHRYDNPVERHNREGGVPRGELAWAMASDLRDNLEPGDRLAAAPEPAPAPVGNPGRRPTDETGETGASGATPQARNGRRG